MRVISGIAKGRNLLGPKSDKIRPALDKVKQAIFNILFDVSGLRVLDLFSGSGSIGIEAISRGSEHCTFVDGSSEGVGLTHKNIALCGFKNQSKVMSLKLPKEIDRLSGETFDLIFIDPPYDKALVNPTLARVLEFNLLNEGGKIIVEHSPREPIKKDYPLSLTTREYGQTWISFLTQENP